MECKDCVLQAKECSWSAALAKIGCEVLESFRPFAPVTDTCPTMRGMLPMMAVAGMLREAFTEGYHLPVHAT